MKIRAHDSKRTTTILLVAGLVIVVIMALGMAYYNRIIAGSGLKDTAAPQNFKYHYALITDDRSSPLWQSVYASAQAAAAEQDAYVELLGSNLSVDYSLSDLMRIAIDSHVDGIILEPNGDPEIVNLINEAAAAIPSIPVITVLEDETQSQRKSFVGVNSYDLGQQYGEQVLDVIDSSTKNVMVLLNEENENTGQFMVFTQIKEMVEAQSTAAHPINVTAVNINTKSPFDSEEAIREIFVKSKPVPDVLVCLDAVDTECAYQSAIDFALVGDVKIIGCYSSDTILKAIKMNNISATLSLDAKQLGSESVKALTEYIESNNVSDYFNVDVTVINKNNVDQFLPVPDETAK